ncbi:patatin-like phospholipase family protein [Bradyrhizobium ottawaense]|uniref:PNPLA domain-containing protein n=1 Tax=Bradyrhizobium ottawaense TaxID=931866 RepID=A0A2U8P0F3_9BRAD|nr:patatin-like phospholipase family protein [Bradyrhizobium ottawaense]AWL91159.1 hypothetical protein CIT37_01695 [Bradyrhizobium ottawaense]
MSRDQVFGLLRNLKWFVVLSLVFSAILSLPAQIVELYRISYADLKFLNLVLLWLTLLLVGSLIWFGSAMVVLESRARLSGKPTRMFNWTARFAPIVLGALPLIAGAAGHFGAIPLRLGEADAKLNEIYNAPGSAFDKFDASLAISVGQSLHRSGYAVLFLTLLAACLWYAVGKGHAAEPSYVQRFRSRSFLLGTIGLILATTAIFAVGPTGFAGALGPFVVLALFAVCITAFCTYASLITVRSRMPWLPLFLGLAVVLSWIDCNDNHGIRTLDGPAPASGLDSATSEFTRWLSLRPDRDQFSKDYPVYVVAARGGGIYAAYQSAIFLARLQDLCPAFRHHLFAISGVSGGSIGASVFSSALATVAQKEAGETACPKIASYLERQSPLGAAIETPGPNERYVRQALSADLLSPLIASTLFGDFLQRFIFRPVGPLDRARALEYSLESATRSGATAGPLEQPFMAHWLADGSRPALLLNATDAASGRRVVFSPFTFGREANGDNVDSLSFFQSLKPPDGGPPNSGPINVPLSTAAFVSARFPWVSPAASVTAKDPSSPGIDKMRLVDGGYFENSGVDTAMDLIDSLRGTIAEINKSADDAPDGAAKPSPRVSIKLIVLGGGSYPERTSFSFGEMLEPIKALLNTRDSRAYIAINRAARALSAQSFAIDVHGTQETSIVRNLRLASLSNPYYPLPLGWTMSDKTREIIEKQSGRFWDCEAGRDFTQSDRSGATADCIQVLLAHELDETVDLAAHEIAIENHYRELGDARQDVPSRLDIRAISRCYADGSGLPVKSFQVHALQALLREWDHHPELTDLRQLAYVLATAAYESWDFRMLSENLVYRNATRLTSVFRIPQDEAPRFVNNPEGLANRIYSGKMGNTEPADGWRYRGRGMIQLTGRGNYQKYAALIGEPLEEEPDLLFNASVASRVTFALFFGGGVNKLTSYFNDAQDDWEGARAVVAGRAPAQILRQQAKPILTTGKRLLACLRAAQPQETPAKLK